MLPLTDFLQKKEKEDIEANIIYIKKIEVPIEREDITKTTFSEKTIVYTYNIPLWNKFTKIELEEIINLFKVLDEKIFKVKEFEAKRKGEDDIEFNVKFEKIREKSVVELVSKVL
jgi:protein tyrosine phosphatase